MDQKKWLSFLSNQPENESENSKTAKIYSKPLYSCKKVLDVGCGEGITLSELKKKGITAIGITINKNDAKKVLEKKNNVVLGDMHELPFKTEFFDGVYSKDSFEHSFAPFVASKEFSRVLKENGILVLVMPEEDWLKEEYHFHYFTPFQITSLLSKSNLFLEKASFNLFYDFYVFRKKAKKEKKRINLIELKYFFWVVFRKISKFFLKIYYFFLVILRKISKPFLKIYFKTK